MGAPTNFDLVAVIWPPHIGIYTTVITLIMILQIGKTKD